MSRTRASLLLAFAALLSCDALYPTGQNANNCVLNPGICDISMGQTCNSMTKKCQGGGVCSAIAQCESPSAVECRSGACVPCEADTQCNVWSTERKVVPTLGRCYVPPGATGGTCGRCSKNEHCAGEPNKSFCDTTTLTCRGCLKHSECDTTPGAGDGLCQRPGDPDSGIAATGQCLPLSMIGYLGNNPAGCQMNPAMASTKDNPYCNPTVARDAMKPVIRVLPSATDYPAISVTTQTLRLIGPGRDASPGATFVSADVNGSGTLTLSDLNVKASGVIAVQCRGGAKLNVIASNITGGTAGIDGNDCSRLTIERTRVNTPGRPAIQAGAMSTTVYRIVNSLVIDSSGGGSFRYAVRFGGNASGVFNYNTITGCDGSVQCANQLPLENSILVKNNGPVSGCDAVSSVTDDAADLLSTGSEPTLKSSQAALTFCIDRGAMPPANEVQTDYFGNLRPKGKGWDKGYHELQ